METPGQLPSLPNPQSGIGFASIFYDCVLVGFGNFKITHMKVKVLRYLVRDTL